MLQILRKKNRIRKNYKIVANFNGTIGFSELFFTSGLIGEVIDETSNNAKKKLERLFKNSTLAQ